MANITTVLGPLGAEKLGYCQMHEHIFVRETPAAEINPALRADDESRSVQDLNAYRAAGGASLLDAQPLGAGRSLSALARLSRASGVNIIAVTGYHMPMFYPGDHWIFTDSVEKLRERFLKELTEGVECEEGRVYPGAVKAAIGKDGPTGRIGECLRAAAGAAAAAGKPLILHTEKGIGAVDAVGICEAEGLAPARVAVCHVDRQAEDFSVHEDVARTGAFLEYDTIARYRYHDDASEMRLIHHMLDFGCADRLLLSLDTTATRLKGYTPDAPGLDFILREFLPALCNDGVARDTLANIMVNNPLRLFGIRD